MRNGPAKDGENARTLRSHLGLDGIILTIHVLAFVAAVAMGIYAYAHVPSGSLVAVHFDMSGTPNGWSTSPRGLFAIPLCSGLLLLMHWFVPRLKPRISEMERRFVAVLGGGVAVLLVIGQWTIVSHAIRALVTS